MTAWTISKWQQWVQCGLNYALEHEPKRVIKRFPGWKIGKLPAREEGPALRRGTEIHEALEVYLTTERAELDEFEFKTPWLVAFKALRKEIAAGTGGTEVLWQFDDQWCETHPGVLPWHRQKLDAWYVYEARARVIDFKTGKRYPDKHRDQMEVYAIGVFAMFEQVDTVVTELWYVDEPEFLPLRKEFDREKDADRLARKWEARAQTFLTDERFEARPGRHCTWCPFNASKGGPCTKGV